MRFVAAGSAAAGFALSARLVRAEGTAAILDLVIGRFLSAPFRAAHPDVTATLRETLRTTDAEGYAGCCAAIRDMTIKDRLGRIGLPTLVITGARDESTPPAAGEAIARAITGAEIVQFDTAHLACVEAAAEFAGSVSNFLFRHIPAKPPLEAARDRLFEFGLKQRKEVLGEAWVHRGLLGRNAFSGEFQAFITRYAWGEIWGRPGLDHRTRRLLVLATTIALGRWEEFKLHVRAGIDRNGITMDELREAIMQSAIYAGVPAANTAFHHAEDVLKELGRL